MGTATYTFNETEGYTSTWTVNVTHENIVVSEEQFTITAPTVKAKYVYSQGGKSGAGASVEVPLCKKVGNLDAVFWMPEYSSSIGTTTILRWNSGAEKQLAISDGGDQNVESTNMWFDALNSTSRTSTVYIDGLEDVSVRSGVYIGPQSMNSPIGRFYGDVTIAQKKELFTVTLDAPPTFDTSVTSSGSYYQYFTPYTVSVSNLSAKYSGSISEVKLTLGSQTATRSNNGTLSITPNISGNITPLVTVTDSRGQVTTKSMPAININAYNAPSIAFDVNRINNNGELDDEGTKALIEAVIYYTNATCNLLEPTVTVTEGGLTRNGSVTWYQDRNFQNEINWTNYNPSSPEVIYGKLTGYGTYTEFNTQKSYQINITPEDTRQEGTIITDTLPSAFYTVDFLAGGHGIAFGQAATQEGFFCAMDAHFEDKANVMRALFDFVHPVGSYYHTSESPANFNPNNSWGGTWSLLGEGQVLLSAGSNYTAGQPYGDNSPTLTDDQVLHSHTATGCQVNEHAASACSRATDVALTNNTGGHAVSVTWPTYAGPSHSHAVASGSNYFMTVAKSPDNSVGRRSIQPGTGTAVTNNLYCNNAISRNASTDAAGTGNCTRSGGSVTVSAHTITQPAFNTPKLTHAVTQPTISQVGTAAARAAYSTMQASTACYIWHRTA